MTMDKPASALTTSDARFVFILGVSLGAIFTLMFMFPGPLKIEKTGMP